MNKKIEIYVSHYKDYYRYENKIFKHYFVGNELNKENNIMNLPGDDTGENISKKNENFNELTLLYWVWKNTKQDYVGFAHYRRFLIYNNFENKKINNIYNGIFRKFSKKKDDKVNFIEKNLFNFTKRIVKDVEKYDIILPYPSIMPITLEEQYSYHHIAEHYKILGKIINEKYPEIYKNYLNTSQRNTFFIANMFITSKKIFDEICSFLFDILFELERRIEIPTDNVQKRIFGFISERLLTVYLDYLFENRNYKIKYLEFLNTDFIFEKLKSNLLKNDDEKRYIDNRKTVVHIDRLKKLTTKHFMLEGWGFINDEESLKNKMVLELYNNEESKKYSNFESYRNDVTKFIQGINKNYCNYDSSGFNFLIDVDELKEESYYKIRIRFDSINSKVSSINYIFEKYFYLDKDKNLILKQ